MLEVEQFRNEGLKCFVDLELELVGLTVQKLSPAPQKTPYTLNPQL